MKPLKLTFYGLNSFKEEQVIDFASLCDGNVFGIFGPTGSGKSTIIDAITLALYGKVERAPDKIRGIVNRSLSEAGACFEFSIGVGTECKMYRVERKYVTKDESISCRLARLTAITPPVVSVLADKPTHVDAEIEALLGLTADDFTRAVVLPQGKFAEFLSLRGKERREMLERIFNLKEYGERLLDLANNRAKEVESQVSKIQGEQQGLGDASSEALLATRTVVLEATVSLTKAVQSLAVSKQLWDEAKVIVETQEKLRHLEERRGAHTAVWPHIANLQVKLNLLDAADVVWPVLAEFDETEKTLKSAQERRKIATVSLTEALGLEHLASEAMAAAKASRQVDEPRLLAWQHDLKRAVVLVEERRELSRLLMTERQATDAILAQLSAVQEQLEGILARERKTVELRTLLRQEVAGNEVSPDERVALDSAIQVEGFWLEARRKLIEKRDEEKSRRASLDKAMSILSQASQSVGSLQQDYIKVKTELETTEAESVPEIAPGQHELLSRYRLTLQDAKYQFSQEQRLSARQESLKQKKGIAEGQMNHWQEGASRASERVATFRTLLTQGQERLKAAKDARIIGELATQVAPGEKCPVCGSRSHPELAIHQSSPNLEHFEAAINEAIALLEKGLAEEGKVTANAEACAREIDELSAQLKEVAMELGVVTSDTARLKSVFPALWVGLSLEDIESNLILEAKLMDSSREERRNWLVRLEKARQGERQIADKLAKATEAQAVALHHEATLQSEFSILQAKVQAQALDESNARRTYDERLGRLGLSDLKEYRESISAKDRKQKELNDTLRQLEEKISSLQSLRQESERTLGLLQEEVASHRLKTEGLLAREEMLSTEIKSLVGDANPLVQSQVAEASLQTLRERVKHCENALATAANQVSQKRSEEASAIEASRLSEDAYERARLRMEQVLRDSPLASREELVIVRENLSSRESWAQEVKEHLEQRALLENDLASLHRVLAGRAVSLAEWTALDAAYLSCQGSRDAAFRTLGQAEARLKDISDRHERFMFLEQQRKALVAERDLVVEICALLRGNALVEFMAGEHLQAVTLVATEWLRILSSHRYALEVDPDGGFLIRDDGQGGLKRPVHTLSGGETFITSLALALALSLQIQLRGKFPLEFFFLDEGFGTLDPELLETVMCCLERMQRQSLSIGIISHVQELVERTSRKIIVTPAERGGRGSIIKIV